MAATEAQKRATNKYNGKTYDQVAIRIPKGKREEYKQFAESQGESLAGMIVRLIEHEMHSGNRHHGSATSTTTGKPAAASDQPDQDVTGTSSQ